MGPVLFATCPGSQPLPSDGGWVNNFEVLGHMQVAWLRNPAVPRPSYLLLLPFWDIREGLNQRSVPDHNPIFKTGNSFLAPSAKSLVDCPRR